MLGKVQAQVQVQVDARDRALAGLSNQSFKKSNSPISIN
jgi:hypothetical protein